MKTNSNQTQKISSDFASKTKKMVVLQNLRSGVSQKAKNARMEHRGGLSFKSLPICRVLLVNIPLFGTKTINLISRHLNLFTAIPVLKQVL